MPIPTIALTPIEKDPLVLKCPHCGEFRLVADRNDVQVPGGGTWLEDGDTVGGLYEKLIAAGLEKENQSRDNDGLWATVNYDHQLMVGTCPNCGEDYFVVTATLIDDAVKVDREFIETYYLHYHATPAPTNYIGSMRRNGETGQWLVQVHNSPQGPVMRHIFGPFHSNGHELRGPLGVARCHFGSRNMFAFARDFLLDLWPTLKATATTANQRT